ncbi:hypothetical protein Micbo1qcDRAFT_159985, partial [Microdochium bolleyi]
MASTNEHSQDHQQQQQQQEQPPTYHDDEGEDSVTANLLPGDADDVLPSHVSPAKDDKSGARWLSRLGQMAIAHVSAIICFIVGAFFATCPRPRHWIPYPFRQILVMILASLIVIPPSLLRRTGSSFGPTVRMRRLLMSYAGMAIAMYALVFTSDDVHIEFRWDSLIWYSTYDGPQLGYLTRTLLAVAGFTMHRAGK